MDRAFIDPATGNTTCVWNAPARADVEALFRKAKVQVKAITQVEEMTAAAAGS
jgi:hypothetical protein